MDRSPRVLVVEDSKPIQRVIELSLRPAGFEVITHRTGRTGLEAAQADPPDLVVLDLGLPDMEGWEVLAELRADERTSRVKVAVLTAHGREEIRTEAELAGADALVTKPFDPSELADLAKELLATARR